MKSYLSEKKLETVGNLHVGQTKIGTFFSKSTPPKITPTSLKIGTSTDAPTKRLPTFIQGVQSALEDDRQQQLPLTTSHRHKKRKTSSPLDEKLHRSFAMVNLNTSSM